MTRSEIEQDVRRINRICKGNPNLPAEEQYKMKKRWEIVENSRNWAAGLIFKRTLEKLTDQGDVPLSADNWEGMFRRVSELMYGYQRNCGYDVNNMILSEPLDGQPHEGYCPQCGEYITWTPAVYEEE